jgi:hypothetical protein
MGHVWAKTEIRNGHWTGILCLCYPLKLDIANIRCAFKVLGFLIFFSGMEAGRNVKVVGEDVAVL